MLTLDRLRMLIPDPALTDAELERIRDDLQTLAEIALAQWYWERDRPLAAGDVDQSMTGAPHPADRS